MRFDPIEEAGRQWRSRWDLEFVTPMMAVTSVMRVQQIWLAELNDALAPHGLTFARYEALMLLYLSRSGALPMGKIGARLQVHPTSVTNLIDGLSARNWCSARRIRAIAARRSRRSPHSAVNGPMPPPISYTRSGSEQRPCQRRTCRRSPTSSGGCVWPPLISQRRQISLTSYYWSAYNL